MNAFNLSGPSIALTDPQIRRSGQTKAASRRSVRKQAAEPRKAGFGTLRPIDYQANHGGAYTKA